MFELSNAGHSENEVIHSSFPEYSTLLAKRLRVQTLKVVDVSRSYSKL